MSGICISRAKGGPFLAAFRDNVWPLKPAFYPALLSDLFRINAFVYLYINAEIEPAMNTSVTNPSWMEPLMPPEVGQKRLEDAAFDLVSRASSLAGQTNPIVTASIGTLVRSMNCYYSNLIKGHDRIFIRWGFSPGFIDLACEALLRLIGNTVTCRGSARASCTH